jgi:hypothetical protein
MKSPDEKYVINVQEHLKIVMTEKNTTGNITTSKILVSQRVK